MAKRGQVQQALGLMWQLLWDRCRRRRLELRSGDGSHWRDGCIYNLHKLEPLKNLVALEEGQNLLPELSKASAGLGVGITVRSYFHIAQLRHSADAQPRKTSLESRQKLPLLPYSLYVTAA